MEKHFLLPTFWLSKRRKSSFFVRKLVLIGTALFLVLCLMASIAALVFADVLQGYLGIKVGTNPQAVAAQAKQCESLSLQVEAEGAVLVQNKENALPFASAQKKLNVFGWASTQWIAGGSGSGRVSCMKTDFLQALEQAGISYNTALTEMYRRFQPQRPFASNTVGTMNVYTEQACRLYEPSIADKNYYSDALLAQAKAYSDTAVVVISRFAGESCDCPKVQYKQTQKDGKIVTDAARTYLELSTEEKSLLAYVGQSFAHVVVLINAPNTMALGAIETTPGVDACLLVGCTGESAAALPALLYGETSPSGRTADTYAYDFSTAPSYANAGAEGVGTYTNAEGLYPADGTTQNVNVGKAALYEGVSYLDYAENLYVGYRWYETADAEGFWDGISNAYGTGYNGVVQYPFGYGLSYTSFSWEIESAPPDGGLLAGQQTLAFRVKVTNIGRAAGQDVVQLYAAPPYTPGGIEKAAVVLAAYAKTAVLQPGESEELTLSAAVRELASYDCYDQNANGFCGYELDAGTYMFSLRHDAHTPEKSAGACVRLLLPETVQYPTDAVTGSAVENRFTGAEASDGVSLDGSDSGAEIVYLSRADFAGTFPKAGGGSRVFSDKLRAYNLYTEADAQEWDAAESCDTPITGAEHGLFVEQKGKITALGKTLGADYDAPEWDMLLDELTEAETEQLALHAYASTQALPSVGKPQTKEVDGPAQIGSFNQIPGTGFPNATVLAQTWNTALARQFGRAVGAQAGQLGYSGWYAPAVNLHRSPLGGRNYEYYSEDSLLSGMMGAAVVSGSLEAGVYCYVKHFAGYDQESLRDGMYVWMTEQTLRELYLEPFRIAVEQGGATGLMTAYGRLGAVWAGGSSALVTEVARGEWGFHGAIVTDYSDHPAYMNADQALRAGGDLWMDGYQSNGKFAFAADAPAFRQALRRAAKDTLYMYLNAQVQNEAYNESTKTPIVKPRLTRRFPIWLPALAALDILAAVCVGRSATAYRQEKRRAAEDKKRRPQ